jgi:lipoprotein-anchoring transpeptidase ErfK/SrfK
VTPGVAKPAQTPASAPPERNIRMIVSKSASSLTLLDEKGAVIFHAPVTSGSQHDPLPLGKWTVTAVSQRPTFHYNPDLFWDADPSHAKAKIPPGPNNPVGLVWIDISREHYGIHGTPEPGKIGHTQSHGCVRLTNWDALYVASLVRKGTVVLFEQ